MYKAIASLLKAIEDGSAWDQHFVANVYIPFINSVDYMAEQMQQELLIANDMEHILKITRQLTQLIVRSFNQITFVGDRCCESPNKFDSQFATRIQKSNRKWRRSMRSFYPTGC